MGTLDVGTKALYMLVLKGFPNGAGCPGSSEVPRNPLTLWDVSSIPVKRDFLTKKLKNKMKMLNGWRTIKS